MPNHTDRYAPALEVIDADIRDAEVAITEAEATLGRLRADLERLHEMRAYFQGKQGRQSPSASRDDDVRSNDGSKEYKGLTIVEAAVRYLEDVGRPADTKEVIREIERRGFASKAKNVYTSVYGTLNREAKKDTSPLDKEDANWTLKAWTKAGDKEPAQKPEAKVARKAEEKKMSA